jgi:hypothetical protein
MPTRHSAVPQRVFQRQKRAPRLAEQMHPAEAERLPHRFDLGHEARNLPERGVVRLVGAARAELIVTDNAIAVLGQRHQRRQIVGRRARSAMQQQQRDRPVAGRLMPDPAARNLDESLGSKTRSTHWFAASHRTRPGSHIGSQARRGVVTPRPA